MLERLENYNELLLLQSKEYDDVDDVYNSSIEALDTLIGNFDSLIDNITASDEGSLTVENLVTEMYSVIPHLESENVNFEEMLIIALDDLTLLCMVSTHRLSTHPPLFHCKIPMIFYPTQANFFQFITHCAIIGLY